MVFGFRFDYVTRLLQGVSSAPEVITVFTDTDMQSTPGAQVTMSLPSAEGR